MPSGNWHWLTCFYRVKEAIEVFGSDDDTHPGVKHLFNNTNDFYVGGKLEAIQRLAHYDFLDLRCKPTTPLMHTNVANPEHGD